MLHIGLVVMVVCHFIAAAKADDYPLMSKVERSARAQAMDHYHKAIFRYATDSIVVTTKPYELDTDYYVRDLMDEMMLALHEYEVGIRIVTSNQMKTTELYNIVIVQTYEEFRKLDLGSATKIFDWNEYFLLVLNAQHSRHSPWEELNRIFAYCWRYYIVNISVLVDTGEDAIELFTYFPFTAERCFSTEPTLLHHDSPLFPRKISNMFNCTLTAALWNVEPYIKLPDANAHRPYTIDGIEGKLLHVITEKLNFSLDFVVPPNNEQRGFRNANGSWSGAVGILAARKAHLSLGSFRCTLERSTVLSPSTTFYQTKQVLTVLAHKLPWKSYEIILYPFRWKVWLILLGMLLGIMVSVPLLKGQNVRALAYVYGESVVLQILLRICGISLGHSTPSMPYRNFARYMLTMWMLLTLVLRSAYQGLLYDLLNTDKNVKPPDTTRELVAKKYTLIVNAATYESYAQISVLRDDLNAIVMNITEDGGLAVIEEHRSMAYVTGSPYDFMVFYVNKFKKYGHFHVLHEYLFTQQLCIYYTKNSFLVTPINWILLRLMASGLIDFWSSQYVDAKKLKIFGRKRTDYHSKALTMSQLHCVFLIHFAILTIAFLVFLGELSNKRRSILKK